MMSVNTSIDCGLPTSPTQSRPDSNQPWQGAKPSGFYRTDLWKLGLFVARLLPARTAASLGRKLAGLYFVLHRKRRDIVMQNVLPAVGGDAARAEVLTRRLFANFGQKMTDLLRYESGQDIEQLVREGTGWKHFQAAHATK